MAVNSLWFKNKLMSQGLSQRSLSKKLGVDPSAFTLFLQGKRRLQLEEASGLARILAVTLDEVLIHAGMDLAGSSGESNAALNSRGLVKSVPIVGLVGEGLGVRLGPVKKPNTAVFSLGVKDSGIEALRYETTGTGLDGMDGALVFFHKAHTVDLSGIGRLCLVKEAGKKGKWLLRVVKRGYESGAFNLFGLSGELMEENALVEMMTPVIWMKM